MQKSKQVLGFTFLFIFLGFLGYKFIDENWDTPGGDVKTFIAILVLILLGLGIVKVLRY